MANTLLSKGVTLKLASTAVGNIVSLSGPNRSVGTVETTNLNSTERTFKGTILDNGEISGQLQFDPDDTQHGAMEALLTASPIAAGSWVVTYTDATPSTYSFSGILTAFSVTSSSVDDLVMADFTIKITGAVTKA